MSVCMVCYEWVCGVCGVCLRCVWGVFEVCERECVCVFERVWECERVCERSYREETEDRQMEENMRNERSVARLGSHLIWKASVTAATSERWPFPPLLSSPLLSSPSPLLSSLSSFTLYPFSSSIQCASLACQVRHLYCQGSYTMEQEMCRLT